MRYLLLSVLVVCMIGVMIPSVFSSHMPEGYDSGLSVIVATDKTTYDIGDTIFIAGSTEGRSTDPYVELSIYQTDCTPIIPIKPPCWALHDTVRVWTEEVENIEVDSTPASIRESLLEKGVPYSGKFTASVNIDSSWKKHIGTYTLVADLFTAATAAEAKAEYYATFTVIDSTAAAAEAKAAAEEKAAAAEAKAAAAEAKAAAKAKAAAELKDLLPPGVVTGFGDDSTYDGTKFADDTRQSVKFAYEWYGFPQKNYVLEGKNDVADVKIISGNGQDLLVYNALLDNTDGTDVFTIEPSRFFMYDGKDRKFSNISYSTITSMAGSPITEIKNPNFSWDEDCTGHTLDVQPGLTGKKKICFEIPKNSDHFKVVYFHYPTPIGEVHPNLGWVSLGADDIAQVRAMFDRLGIDTNTNISSGGGCLIATATFGSEMAPQVQFLRELRDNTVLQTESGTSFMAGFNQFYYSFSPAVADYERENPVFKEAVKITLTPLLTSLTLLQYTDIDSESEMLGYGIGIILLNIGMYFVAPAVVIMVVRKRIKPIIVWN